ncbi:MAG: hypothetical protein HY286_17425 [Planctomycetes bacterium]|nr:hypothetical protein [Planctomycetota bacterium]
MSTPINSLRRTAAMASLALLCACAGNSVVQKVKLPERFVESVGSRDKLQISLLVALPSFLSHPDVEYDAVQHDRVIAEIDRAFREGGYLRLPTSEFRDRLRISRTPDDNREPTDLEFAKAAKAMGADAVLIIDHLNYTGYSVMLWTHRSLGGSVRMLDVDAILENSKREHDSATPVLWQREFVSSETEGPVADLEMLVTQVVSKYDKDAVARIYHQFALELLGAFSREVDPERTENSSGSVPRERLASKPPTVDSVRVVTTASGDPEIEGRLAINVEASGTPNCVAEALLPGYSEPFPLDEDPMHPGSYRGKIEVHHGIGSSEGSVCVRLRDRHFRFGGLTAVETTIVNAPALTKADRLLKNASNAGAFAALRSSTAAIDAGFRISSRASIANGPAQKK